MKSFEFLKQCFTRLPGVGPRQASRFVLSLLNQEEKYLVEFARAIANLKQEVKFCGQCFYIRESKSGTFLRQSALEKLCPICQNPRRNQNQIMLVEKITDLEAVERTHKYSGLYHVLGGAINPPEGINAEHLKIKELLKRIEKSHSPPKKEIILALSPTTTGDATALYLNEQLKKYDDKITVTALARGLSFGSLVEYVDELTLQEALKKRR